jgi:AAA+ ATPase superfamily predicted ATPase
MFIDRHHELRLLQDVAQQTHPGPGQLLLLYGRRRVGKTALLQHWANQSGIAWTYWMARKEPSDIQRRRLLSTLLEQPTSSASPTFATWSDLWDATARILRDQRHLLIVDELPYAIESDPAMLSALQYAWDTHFQQSGVILALCGSHVRTMESILSYQSPLFGRMTAQLQLRPLPFGVLHHFFPTWSDDERVATYAILGGVPAYLGWFDPTRALTENIRTNLLRPTGMALAEVEFLLYDEVREPRIYLTILDAIGNGAHTLSAISAATLIASPNLTVYLKTLQELRLIERRIPATVPPALRDRSKQGRYHLIDPFHRFYFRFLQPNQAEIGYQPDQTLLRIQAGLRAFVGQTTWEELAREWVLHQSMAGQLPVTPEVIGSHWDRDSQADLVAINWKSRTAIVGECKWGIDPVDRQIVRHLLDHTLPAVQSALPDKGDGWQIFPLLVARAGATPAAEQELRAHQGILVSLEMLARDLERAVE